jgi:hypothetical protein
MTRRILLASLFTAGLALVLALPRATVRVEGWPSQLSDEEFWRVATDFSEPNGYFRSDNLTSNELGFQYVIPDLLARTRQGGAYLGVGPEQNFTYIAAVRPAVAIIFDIRRGNMLVQLMYKALFELAKDRADFVSMLFAKPRPPDLGASATAAELFMALDVPADAALYERTLAAIRDRLTKTHRLNLSAEDLRGIEYAYRAFFMSGFAVRRWPTYDELMTQADTHGVNHSYLASEARFGFMKDLESRNLVIPVVGDFGGPKAIRGVGDYLTKHGLTVTAFYLSNVEQYLYQDGKRTAFCHNVAALPLDGSSTFIRSTSRGGGGFLSSLGGMASEVKDCGRF